MKLMFSRSLSPLFLALFALVSHTFAIADDADTASRIDLLEQRIEALERLVKSQSSMIEESLQQHQRNLLHEPVESCLPTRNHDGVCVYDHDVKFLYHDAEIVFENSDVEFSFAKIAIDNSNTTFYRNTSLPDTSNVVFDSTKIRYSHVDESMSGSSSSVTDSSIDYGSNTNVHWHGDSASAYFTDGVDLMVDHSDVVFDDTIFELKGDHGSTLSRVQTHFQGPEFGDAIDVLFTRRVDVRFQQSNAIKVSSDMDFEFGSDVLVKDGASLEVNGRLQSNDETEFSGGVKMVGVSLDIEGDLFIDGHDGFENSEIEFRSGVEVSFSNDVSMARNLDVEGEVEADTLDISEGATIRGRLSCRKGATISGDTSGSSSSTSMYSSELLRVEGGAKINRNLRVDGSISTDSNLDVEGMADIRSLEVQAATKLYSLTVEGGSTNVGTLSAGSGSFSGKISGSRLDIANNADIGGSLATTGEIVVGTDLTVTGSTEIGTPVFEDLVVVGDATIGGALVAGGPRGIEVKRIFVENNVTLGGSLNSGALNVRNQATVRNLDVQNHVQVGKNADISGSLTVDGAAVP